jgi:Outer membrane protein beta-barrel domain
MRTFWTVLDLSAFVLCISSISVQAQTDVAASLYGAFSSSTSGNGTTQSPSNAAGVLLELGHIWNPLVGFEATYSYNRANQAYSSMTNPPCPVGIGTLCGPTRTTAAIPANAHEIAGDWVASVKFATLRPFALAGGGILLDVPTVGTVTAYQTICSSLNSLCQASNVSVSTGTQAKGVFVYGAGLDWTMFPHLGLRFQYRGNFYKAPDLAKVFSSTNSFTQNSEPMIGAFVRF